MIIVTGGAGFIGSNIIAGLEEHGRTDIVVVDRFGKGEKWRNLAKRNLYAVILPEDLLPYVRQHEKQIDFVIHMGAISSTTEQDVDLIVQTNFSLTMELWRFCAQFQKRLIYASSAATYGAGERGFADISSIEFLNDLRPLNAYGWSKALVDRAIAREQGGRTPLQCVGLKFFNVYGPNEYHKGGQQSVIAQIYPNVAADCDVELFKSYRTDIEDGEQRRDFVWVGDVVSVVLWMMEHPEVSGIFNVGTGEARTFNELARSVWKAVGKTPKIVYKDMPEKLRETYQYFTEAKLDRLRMAGYDRPMASLEDGVATYVNDYLACADCYR